MSAPDSIVTHETPFIVEGHPHFSAKYRVKRLGSDAPYTDWGTYDQADRDRAMLNLGWNAAKADARHADAQAVMRGGGDMSRTVVYIAGPYRAKTERDVMLNIRRAESVALTVWQAGMVALCPHMNTAFFGGACDDTTWLAGDLELLRRCDAVLLVPGWENSTGTLAEIEFARQHGIPVFYKSFTLGRWYTKRKAGQAS